MSAGDTLIDGGNSYYRDSKRRALALSQQGLRYIDAGVSGGVHGLANGFCLMLGGTAEIDRDLRAVRQAAGARRRARLAALRAERRRALRQDDPQRHRVRNDAVARRGLRAARRAARARHRRRRAWPRPGATAAWCARGCSTCAPRSSRTTKTWPASRRWSPIRAKGAGPRSSRSSSASRRRSISLALMSRFSSQGGSDYARKLLAMMRAGFGGHAVDRKTRDRHRDGRLRRRARRPSARPLAAQLGWRYLDADDYHPPENVAKMAAGTPAAG